MNGVRLLAADEPSPVRVLRPDGVSDVFLTADHAGRLIPRVLGDLGVSAVERERHIAWDIGIARVTELLSAALDATAVLQTYSRLVIDCNRDPAWLSATPAVSEVTRIPGNEGLSAADRALRRDEIFMPYHRTITELLDARAGRPTLLIAMHSFTPVFKGAVRAVEVGVLHNVDAPDQRPSEIMLELLGGEGDLVVGDNQPYAITGDSDYTVPVHGEQRGLPHLELEIRQDLIGDAAGQEAWAARLAGLLPILNTRLRG